METRAESRGRYPMSTEIQNLGARYRARSQFFAGLTNPRPKQRRRADFGSAAINLYRKKQSSPARRAQRKLSTKNYALGHLATALSILRWRFWPARQKNPIARPMGRTANRHFSFEACSSSGLIDFLNRGAVRLRPPPPLAEFKRRGDFDVASNCY